MTGIDAHQHFWSYDAVAYDWIGDEMAVLKRDFLPPDLAPLLADQDLAGCVAVQARQTDEETDFLLELAREHEIVAGVVGWLDLRSDQLERKLADYTPFPKLKGIRHIVQAEADPDFMLQDAFLRGVRILAKAGLTYDILVFERQFPMVLRFLEQCPDQPFVLDHLGKPVIAGGPSANWREGIRHMAEHPQVYCKVSGLVTEADWTNWSSAEFIPFLDVVFEAFGPERVMYGSDWPVCLLAADQYQTVYQLVDEYTRQLTETERAAFFGGNARNFYKL